MSVIQFIKNNTASKIAIGCIVAFFLILLIVLPFYMFMFIFASSILISIFTGGLFAVMYAIEQYQDQKRWGGRK